MSIVVTSTTDTAVQAPAPVGENAGEKSALAPKQAAEQSTAEESDTPEAEGSKTETEESDADAESKDDAEATEDPQKDKPKKKSGAQRRKERAERAEAEAERARTDLEYWKQQALKGAGEPKVETEAKTPKVENAGEPDPDDFQTHAEYVKAVVRWDREQADKATKEQDAKSKLEADQRDLAKSYSERVKSFAEQTEDYWELMEAVDDVPLSPAVEQLLLSSENGPQISYELAKNRAEFERIVKLAPLAAARELGKIEARLESKAKEASKPEPKKTTSAPAPIAPVGAKGGAVEKSIHDVAASGSQADYEALRRKQMKQRSASW